MLENCLGKQGTLNPLAIRVNPEAKKWKPRVNPQEALARVNPTRRWLQDTSKRKLADFSDFFRAPFFLFPRVNPRLTRRWIKAGAPDEINRVDCNF